MNSACCVWLAIAVLCPFLKYQLHYFVSVSVHDRFHSLSSYHFFNDRICIISFDHCNFWCTGFGYLLLWQGGIIYYLLQMFVTHIIRLKFASVATL